MKYERMQGYTVTFNVHKPRSPEMISLKTTYENMVETYGSSFSIKELKIQTRQGVNTRNVYDRESAATEAKKAMNEAKQRARQDCRQKNNEDPGQFYMNPDDY